MRRALTLLAFLAAVAAPCILLAHEGHAHHVMGTVKAVDAKHIEVKDTSDQTVSVQLTAETRYLRGETPANVSDIKVGERIMVEAAEKDGATVAQVVRLETSAPQKPNK